MIKLYTDGSCPVPNGPWGYAAVKITEGVTYFATGGMNDFISGGGKAGTNNIAELTAVIKGLEWLLKDNITKVDVISDSQYIVNAFNKGWLKSWKKRDWKRSSGQLTNIGLWKILDSLTEQFDEIKFVWVRGHNGDPNNELADKLAARGREDANR